MQARQIDTRHLQPLNDLLLEGMALLPKQPREWTDFIALAVIGEEIAPNPVGAVTRSYSMDTVTGRVIDRQYNRCQSINGRP